MSLDAFGKFTREEVASTVAIARAAKIKQQ